MSAKIIALLIFVLIPGLALAASFPQEPTDVDLKMNDVKWQCEGFIIQTLDYPSKAKFEYFANFPAQKLAGNIYTVDATFKEDEEQPLKTLRCTLQDTISGWHLQNIAPKS